MNPFWEPPVSISIGRRDDNTLIETGETPTDESARYLGRPLRRRQLLFLVILIAVGFLSIGARAFSLQVMDGDYYRELADGNRIRTRTVLAPRGLIYDRFGRPLTENSPNLSLAFIPFDLPRDEAVRDELFGQVSQTSGLDIRYIQSRWEELSQDRKESTDPYPLETNLPIEEGLRLQVLAAVWPGVTVITGPRRSYQEISNEFSSLSHVIGYMGRVTDEDLSKEDSRYVSEDSIGKTGLEYSYESLLKGKNGEREVEVNALGEEQYLFAQIEPVSGQQLWLTLDLDLQKVAEQALRKGLVKAGSARGAVVALDPRTGAVLALVSLPAFNANEFTSGLDTETYEQLISNPDRPLFNRAVQGRYPSGSIIKPIIAAAALEDKIITDRTYFRSVGGIRVSRWFFPDWKAGGHGLVDVRKAIAESVNTFFYIIGGGYEDIPGLGISRIKYYADRFGLSEKTGIDLPNEAKGLIPTPEWKQKVKGERWYIGDTYHAAIGQGDVLVTPLEVANFMSVFANGGTLFQPYLVFETSSGKDGGRARTKPREILSEVVSSTSLDIVKQGLRQAVTKGSARALADLPIAVAGKTGTAELGGVKEPHAWFTGFAPFDNPEIVVVVLLEEAGEGSSYAVPVAKEVFLWWALNRLEE